MSREDTFFSCVKIDHENPDGCWTWLAHKDKDGYGKFRMNGAMRMAHRLCYEFRVGAIQEGLTIDHLCGNRACVNPRHLEPVTFLENVRRSVEKRTRCPNGHEYDPSNVAKRGSRKRACRICERARHSRYRQQRKEHTL